MLTALAFAGTLATLVTWSLHRNHHRHPPHPSPRPTLHGADDTRDRDAERAAAEGRPSYNSDVYGGPMSSGRSVITISTDARTKERVRRHAQAAGVDLSTYVSVAVHAAMRRDEEVARSFAVLDAVIEDAESAAGPPPPAPGVSPEESAAIDDAMDGFFSAPHGGRGPA